MKSKVVVASEGSPLNTQIYVVDEDGGKTKIPGVVSAKWIAKPGQVCKLFLRIAIPGVNLENYNVEIERTLLKVETVNPEGIKVDGQ